jgi:YVTN family beta-propeller protein
MKKSFWLLVLIAGITANLALATNTNISPNRAVILPGLRNDSSVLLPNQWSLRPAGKQVTLGDFPVNIAVHPQGRYAAVIHCGYSKHEIVMVDLKKGEISSRQELHEAFYGLEFSKSGARLYCSGSSDEVVHVFDFNDGTLSSNSDIVVSPQSERGIPCGLAVSGNSGELYVANLLGQFVSKVNPLTRGKLQDFQVMNSHSELLKQTNFSKESDEDEDQEAVTKRMKAELDPISPSAPFPYACRLDDRRNLLYVSLWNKSCVSVLDVASGMVIATIPTDEHPNEMVLTRSGNLLYVANGNRNTVTLIDTSRRMPVETLYASFNRKDLPGSSPSSLALSPDEKTLYVANACNNNIAVFDVSTLGNIHSIGFIPVGWYPTSVRVTPDGRQLLVANGKGVISRPNPEFTPHSSTNKSDKTHYIGELFSGTLSIINLPSPQNFKRQMAEWTREAFQCVPARSVPIVEVSPGNPIPIKIGERSPIKHCIYIIKENRTYDQIFGDIKGANGDEKLCLFPQNVTPNLHKLVNEFVILDNFYVDAEVSADGHEWSMAAFATDYVEKIWPLDYAHNKSKKFTYPSEGHFPVAFSSGGYLWDKAKEAGVSYLSLGEFISHSKDTNHPGFTRVESLKGHFDPWYRSFDTDYPDVLRAERFIHDLNEFETNGKMPGLLIVKLPNDHTSGGAAGKPTPRAQVADNDRALGMVIEAITHSRYWPQTAVFVLEDDAQDGPDHVDAHRSTALVISPYVRRHRVDSTMFSTSSMLHTMELILGLKPMSQFDAAATPMHGLFDLWADTTPYDSVPANINLHELNPKVGKNAKLSSKMDLRREDAVDDRLMNEVIWRSIRGEDSPMPSPTHAAFVMTNPKVDSDD